MTVQKLIQLNFLVFGSLICFNLSFFGLILKYQSLKRKINLVLIELTTSLLLLADCLAYIYRGDTSELGFWMVRISNFSVFALIYVELIFATNYLSTFIDNEKRNQIKRLSILYHASGLGLSLVIISQFTGLLYTFDANNCYQRGRFFLWSFIAPLVIYILVLSVVVQFRENFSKPIFIALMVFGCLPIVASIAQAFMYGWSLLNLSLGIAAMVLFALSLIDQNRLLAKTAASEKFTGLPNSYGYIQELGKKIARKQHAKYNAIYFDIAKMGLINKKYGNDFADQLIINYAQTMRKLMQEDEVLGRLGGNYFVALVRKKNTEQFLDRLSGLKIKMHHPEEEREVEIEIKAIAGLYEICPEDTDPGAILNNICTVGNIAKQEKHVSYLYLTPELVNEIDERRKLQERIRKAIQLKEFVPYYQPKVDVETRMLVGAEALTRWEHKGELIPPSKFIPLLEQNDRICKFDFYMLDRVCDDISKWLKEGLDVPVISINFSRKNLANPNLAEDIYNVIKSYNIPAELIQVEITETIDEYSLSDLKNFAEKLKGYGITVAIDDFGTGSSSVELIKKVPFDVLKIDKTFIDSIDSKDLKILGHLIAMANVIGATTLVEGVEVKEQVEILQEMKCKIIQGYYFDKPLQKDVFVERIKHPKYNI